jgi:hypothetical protein
MKEGTRALIATTPWSGVERFGNVLKFKEFPDGARNGTCCVGMFWPVNEVAAVCNRRSGKPSLDKYRGVKKAIVEGKIIEEGRSINMSGNRAF